MTLCLLAISAALSTSASAQPAQPPAVAGPGNEAISTTQDPNAAGPVKGANSFTEDQARARIEANGFTNVSRLTKDADGIWRGTAMSQGENVAVALDFKGDVFPRR
jgi:putative membrane protein